MFVNNIEPNELVEWLKRENPPRLIDVRTPPEMMQQSIKTSALTIEPIPLATLPMRFSEIPKDEDVVFYCRTGARSGQACMFMAQQGYNNVYNLGGGIFNWMRQGYPVAPMSF